MEGDEGREKREYVLEKQTVALETHRKSDIGFSRSSHVLISTWGPTQSMDASQKSNLGFLVKEMCLWSWQPLSLCKFYGM
jgi:hypothetical protein